jgi:hypothetical protein
MLHLTQAGNERLRNRHRKRNIGVGFLVGLWVFLCVANVFASEEKDNFIAIHDSSSRQYKKHCTDCHASVHTAQSLDPAIPVAHVAMHPFAPGKDDKQCVWCHRSVDLVQGTQSAGTSTGNLRKHIDATLCTVCHGPFGPGAQFYQAGPSPTDPDGAALYELVCAACHKDLAHSKVRGESAAEIQKKIDENEGGMGPLGVLSPEEIQAIADALAR